MFWNEFRPNVNPMPAKLGKTDLKARILKQASIKSSPETGGHPVKLQKI